MFIEPSRRPEPPHQRTGWIEVICGSMFSGKTEELIRRLNRALIARLTVRVFKPAVDTRYHDQHIVSHNANTAESIPVRSAHDILDLVGNCEVVGIDEAQFFDDKELLEVCNRLANEGKRVILAGLDMDFEGKPFGCMPQLMAIAEYVTKVHAICVVCGDIASYSYRLVPSKKVLLGETDSYEARCRNCYQLGERAGRREWIYEKL